MEAFAYYFDVQQPQVRYVLLCVALAPLIWNILARLEYYGRVLSRLFCGHRYAACYALAVYIFLFSLYRDYQFTLAMEVLPKSAALMHPAVQTLGAVLVVLGSVFVLSSMWALGVTGTYLGDYFGILMDAPVTSFPFNVMRDPMYDGATMVFAGHALWNACPGALVITAWIYVCYRIALRFEGPFTTKIYAERDAKGARKRRQ